MTRVRYTMPARSQGNLYMQRAMARLAEKDIPRWLITRLDGPYCDLQVMYMAVCGQPFCLDDMEGGAM